MPAAVLIFPHQLFLKHPALHPNCVVFLVEEHLYFNHHRFHKKKLVLHRASMQYYYHWLQQQGYTVHYVDATERQSDVRVLLEHLHQKAFNVLHFADVADDWLQRRIEKAATTYGMELKVYRTPMFLNTPEETAPFFDAQPRYFLTDFYINERKKRALLLDADGQPLGGKWSFDAENRLRYPKGFPPPQLSLPNNQTWVPEAIQYVEKHYTQNWGNTEPPFFKRAGFYPVTHAEAEQWLDDFLVQRFALFGAYEDAMVAEQGTLFHSVLTPMLNTGLLTPQQVLTATLHAAAQHNIPLNSLEGFVRQLVGWREFIRLVYHREGRKQRRQNAWNFTRPIPLQFYTGQTGILPIDIVVAKVLQSGYTHHIERLMVLGSFMLLCEFHPDSVYLFFMELFVDAYDWVMVPNTYGMTQLADGSLMATKPYISASNYLRKMGNWKPGPWQAVWDGLFWRFLHVHRAVVSANPRIGMLVQTFDAMPHQTQQAHLQAAHGFLKKLDEWNAA